MKLNQRKILFFLTMHRYLIYVYMSSCDPCVTNAVDFMTHVLINRCQVISRQMDILTKKLSGQFNLNFWLFFFFFQISRCSSAFPSTRVP